MEQTYPPYAAGSIVTPRQLNRWMDINPQNGALQRVSTTVTLPAFSVANSWNGYSNIVASFNFEAPNNISLTNYAIPENPNYVLCVSCRVGTIVTRYLLWDATGSNLNQTITPYTGQPLLKNFRFEVWNTSQGGVSNNSSIVFTTSKKGTIDYRYGNDVALVNGDGENDLFALNGNTVSFSSTGISPYLWFNTSPLVGLQTTITDKSQGIVLTKTGLAIIAASAYNLRGGMLQFLQANFSNILVNQIVRDVWFLLSIEDQPITSTILSFTAGNVYSLSLDCHTKTLTAWPTVPGPSIVLPNHQTSYIIRVTNTGTAQTLTAYDMFGNIVVNNNTAFIANTGINRVVIGDSTTNPAYWLGELIMFPILYENAHPVQEILQYFASTFLTYGYTLPLTFPLTSVSTTN